MIVIDPMHNLILGIMQGSHTSMTFMLMIYNLGLSKNHFYHMWIAQNIIWPKHELVQIHALLSKVCIHPFQCLSSQFWDTWLCF